MKRLLFFLSMIIPLSFCSSQRPSGPIVSYHYTYSTCVMYPIYEYEVVLNASGKQTLNYSRNDGVMHPVPLEEDVLGKIDAIVKEYKLYRLKEHYMPPFDVLDGWSWNVQIGYQGESIYSGGSNARPPKKLQTGLEEINAYLKSFIPEED